MPEPCPHTYFVVVCGVATCETCAFQWNIFEFVGGPASR